jgi:hypothetical protein
MRYAPFIEEMIMTIPELTLNLSSHSQTPPSARAASSDTAMNSRRLQVTSPPQALRWSPVSQRNSAPIPYLRLRGRWLERADFAAGSTVPVPLEPGRHSQPRWYRDWYWVRRLA